jgi:hypothetical protein
MNETDWLASNDPQRMLEYLRGKVSDRKLRLFVYACCRRMWQLMRTEEDRRAVEKAERWADGLESTPEVRPPVARTRDPESPGGWNEVLCEVDLSPYQLAERYTFPVAWFVAGGPNADFAYWDPTWQQTVSKEMDHQAALLRDVSYAVAVGTITLDPLWLTPTVTNLAEGVYEERHLPTGELDLTRLAVLADALEDAGCDNAEVLSHCRGFGPHVRGCWVVDLLLGKE